MRLAERLGMTVHHMLHTMSSRELSEWMALAMIDDEDRRNADLRAQAQSKLESRPPRKR